MPRYVGQPRFWQRGLIRCASPSMIDPDNTAWLRAMVDRSALLPEPGLRTHWQRLIPFLSTAQRYELAAVLLEAEHALTTQR